MFGLHRISICQPSRNLSVISTNREHRSGFQYKHKYVHLDKIQTKENFPSNPTSFQYCLVQNSVGFEVYLHVLGQTECDGLLAEGLQDGGGLVPVLVVLTLVRVSQDVGRIIAWSAIL